VTSVARELGLPANVVVAAGGGDTATSALGIGAAQAGDSFVSLGTSGVLSVVTEQFRSSPQLGVLTLCHAIPNRWHRTSVVLSAASCIRWLCNLVSVDEAPLLAEVESIGTNDRVNAPLFLPYLSGERTPHNDPHAQGVFFGLSPSTTRATLAYSVLEGVAFALSDAFDVLRADGTTASSLSLIGGGARSEFWAQLIVDALGVPIRRPPDTQCVAALGAARLAWLATDGDFADVVSRPRLSQEFVPNEARRPLLLERFASYRALYRQLRPIFPQ